MEFLTYLLQIGLTPQARITVESRTPFGDVMTLKVDGQPAPVAIGRDVASNIWVVSLPIVPAPIAGT